MIDLSFLNGIPLFYISPDIKRALGLEEMLKGYTIICSEKNDLVDLVRKKGCTVFCLEEEIGKTAGEYKNTSQILSNEKVNTFIQMKSNGKTPHILYFKPNLKVDFLCEQKGYKKLVNQYELNESFENKINFFELTKTILPQYTLSGWTGKISDFKSENEKNIQYPFVVQFGHGWAGKTTFVVKNENDLENLRNTFQYTNVKITPFIDGYTILNNCCIYEGHVFVGSPAIQLSGIDALSSNPSVTCGRQWPQTILSKEQVKNIKSISETIGLIMSKKGYKGYFGLDFIVSKKDGKIFISENNARFTASVPFFTKREIAEGKMPLLVYHIAAFMGKKDLKEYDHPEIIGAQIIIRNTKSTPFVIKKEIKQGIFRIKNNTIEFLREGYEINSIKEDEFILSSKSIGTKVNKDEEIARIETKQKVIEKNGILTKDFDQTISLIKSSL